MIVSNGPDAAEIMFIADYCLREDAVHGYALSGSQEKTLGGFIKKARFSLNQCYRTAYIKDTLEYDGKNKKQKFLAIKKAFDNATMQGVSYEEILKNEIYTIRPNVIVPLGDLSLKFITGYSPISAYRGSVLPLNPLIQTNVTEKTIRCVATFSPRMVWENHTSGVYVQLDYNKIVELKESRGPIEPEGQVWVCRSVEAFRQFIARHQDIHRRDVKDQFITFDIETYLGVPTAIGFSFDGKEAFSIPLFGGGLDYANLFLLFVEVSKLLTNPIGKVNQNIKYDWSIVERFGLEVNNVIGDTTVGFHLLYPELPKNLGFQTSIYTKLPYFKDESSKKDNAYNPKSYTKDTLYLYNAKDALATWQIHRAQLDEIEEQGNSKIYHEKLVPLIQVYKNIDGMGLLVDQKKKKKLLGKYRSILEVTATRFMKLLQPVIEFDDIMEAKACVRSYVKLGHLIYEILKYPPRYNTTDGGKRTYKTDKETLDELRILYAPKTFDAEVGRRILNYVITIKKLYKVLEYIQTPLHPDGTLKTTYNQTGTENARTSASKTIDQLIQFDDKRKLIWPMKRLGRSLQTITKHGFEIDGELYDGIGDNNIGADLRHMFIPRPGYVYMEGDGGSAESRVVAVLAEDYDMLKSHDVKPKIHARTAGALFDIDPLLITKDFPIIPDIGMTYYDMGKRTRHAGHLGVTEFRLAQLTHLDIQTCREKLAKFHAANPKIRGIFHHETYEQVKKTGQLRSPFGRVRQFFERLHPSIAKEIYANLPQSTVSDQTKFAMLAIAKRAKDFAFMVYEGHDAAMAEVRRGHEREFNDIFHEEYETPIDFRGCSLSRDIDLVIPAEISIGENWSAKGDENPNGMEDYA